MDTYQPTATRFSGTIHGSFFVESQRVPQRDVQGVSDNDSRQRMCLADHASTYREPFRLAERLSEATSIAAVARTSAARPRPSLMELGQPLIMIFLENSSWIF